MIHINEMPMDFEPRRKILPQLPDYVSPQGEREPEMSESQSAFLCGAIKKFRPKKVLEVGVAVGATTAIILQTLEDLDEPYEMHSVDLSEKFYLAPKFSTGFMATFAKEKVFDNLRGTHKFYLGKVLPQVIDEIGGDIDFVILDTMHLLPGEVLDFIAVLPYLKSDAVIVMHDVVLHQWAFKWNEPDAIAIGVLFSAVVAEKFLNFEEQGLFRYPNIAAFKVSTQTAENIDNVFLSLILRWNYLPPEEQMDAYFRLYQRFYSVELCEIFQKALYMNAYNFYRLKRLVPVDKPE